MEKPDRSLMGIHCNGEAQWVTDRDTFILMEKLNGSLTGIHCNRKAQWVTDGDTSEWRSPMGH